jgi:hypothetical protein
MTNFATLLFGYLQGSVQKKLPSTKNNRQSPVPANQKNRSTKEQLSLPSLKRSGFVLNFANTFSYHSQTKRSDVVFLMRGDV